LPTECLVQLQAQPLTRIEELPHAFGIYALADHLGAIRYIGMASSTTFRDRIFSRHVNGSEERSHKLACNYNIGRMWRDRKSQFHVPSDAKLAKRVRREFIRRHCGAACVPLSWPKQDLRDLEKRLLAIAPAEMTSWNRSRIRINQLPEPRNLVDSIINDMGLSEAEIEALERQSILFNCTV
ncbi:hypothetical protein LC593_36820, partial [Nostoc sp. CHAB 5844]|nr:hypothetical protein [Nostoc sp. CHAB 5844]